jgi:hypothetical protein
MMVLKKDVEDLLNDHLQLLMAAMGQHKLEIMEKFNVMHAKIDNLMIQPNITPKFEKKSPEKLEQQDEKEQELSNKLEHVQSALVVKQLQVTELHEKLATSNKLFDQLKQDHDQQFKEFESIVRNLKEGLDLKTSTIETIRENLPETENEIKKRHLKIHHIINLVFGVHNEFSELNERFIRVMNKLKKDETLTTCNGYDNHARNLVFCAKITDFQLGYDFRVMMDDVKNEFNIPFNLKNFNGHLFEEDIFNKRSEKYFKYVAIVAQMLKCYEIVERFHEVKTTEF